MYNWFTLLYRRNQHNCNQLYSNKNQLKKEKCMRWCCCFNVAKSCLTLWDPMDYSPPGSSVHGISQARILRVSCHSFSMGSSCARGSNLCLLWLLHCQADSLPSPWGGMVSSVQSLSHIQLFVTPWTAARQASLSITNSRSLLKLMSIKSVMPSNHLIHHHPLLLLPSFSPSIKVISNESVLCIRWPKYRSLSFSISLSNEYSGLISFRMDWLDLLTVQETLKGLSKW